MVVVAFAVVVVLFVLLLVAFVVVVVFVAAVVLLVVCLVFVLLVVFLVFVVCSLAELVEWVGVVAFAWLLACLEQNHLLRLGFAQSWVLLAVDLAAVVVFLKNVQRNRGKNQCFGLSAHKFTIHHSQRITDNS